MNDTTADRTQHWNAVYRAKAPTGVSWYQPHLAQSLACIRACPEGTTARVIDVGGGVSTLVDDLLQEGFRHVTVLDVSDAAVQQAKARLGAQADSVDWITGDVTRVALPKQAYDVWHDRAVFHFLTDADDRHRYAEQVCSAVRPGGQVIVATFSLEGPPRCSGLEVVRYSPATLQQALEDALTLVDSATELHRTPVGGTQPFIYCRFRVQGAP